MILKRTLLYHKDNDEQIYEQIFNPKVSYLNTIDTLMYIARFIRLDIAFFLLTYELDLVLNQLKDNGMLLNIDFVIFKEQLILGLFYSNKLIEYPSLVVMLMQVICLIPIKLFCK